MIAAIMTLLPLSNDSLAPLLRSGKRRLNRATTLRTAASLQYPAARALCPWRLELADLATFR
jgi:hypothetical protein